MRYFCSSLKDRAFYALIFSVCILSCSSLSPQTPTLFFNPVISSGLTSPVDIVNASDGSNRLFVVERGGTVKILSGGTLLGASFLDVSSLVGTDGERGLLSMAFHPAFSTNGFFFVYYADRNGDVTVARYHVNPAQPNVAEPSSGQVLLAINHREFSNHNGGKLNFGVDGNLYFAVGDGGNGGDPHFNAQNGNVLLGKMMRINVDNFTTAPYYSIPPDNPFVTDPDVADEIWALGLRNPFRWSFDRLTHDMWIGDVGQNLWEEVDFRPAGNTGGVNYGWRCMEGNHTYNDSGCNLGSNYVAPVFEYTHNATGGISITGGYVYRGTDYPSLYGKYLCVDYGTGNGWLIQPDGSGGWAVSAVTGLPASIVGFGESESGELYAVNIGNNTVYRVQVTGTLPVKLQTFTVAEKDGRHLLSWTTASSESGTVFEVESSRNGSDFSAIGKVPADNSRAIASYHFENTAPAGGAVYYRLKIKEPGGAISYSAVVKMDLAEDNLVQVSPTLVRNGQLTIKLSRSFTSLQIMDINGRSIRKKTLDGNAGIIYEDLSGLTKGMYIIRLTGTGKDVTKRITVE